MAKGDKKDIDIAQDYWQRFTKMLTIGSVACAVVIAFTILLIT